MADEFTATGFECAKHEKTGAIRMVFENDEGGHRAVVVPQYALPMLLAQVQQRIEPGQVTPIRPDHLHPGQSFVSTGFRIGRHQGGALLTLFGSIIESGKSRGVTIPVVLPEQHARDLAEAILHYLRDPSATSQF